MKCVPFSFSFDKLTIIENFSSLNVGILSIENVPRNEQLIFSLSHRYIYITNSFFFHSSNPMTTFARQNLFQHLFLQKMLCTSRTL